MIKLRIAVVGLSLLAWGVEAASRVDYEDFDGHKLDRKFLDLLRKC